MKSNWIFKTPMAFNSKLFDMQVLFVVLNTVICFQHIKVMV